MGRDIIAFGLPPIRNLWWQDY